MNIYLIRHTEAEPASQFKKDSERVVTTAGIELLKTAIENWNIYITSFNYLFCSPFKRAVQTAEVIASSFEITNNFIIDKTLKPGSNTSNILDIAKLIEVEDIAFIGHQPDIGFMISQLISSYDVNLKVSPATIVKISFKGKIKSGKGKLELLLPPPVFKNG